MTILPELQRELVAAARRRTQTPPRRSRGFGTARSLAGALAATAAAVAVIVVFAGGPTDQGERSSGRLSHPSVQAAGDRAADKARALSRAPNAQRPGRQLDADALDAYLALLGFRIPYPPGRQDRLDDAIRPPLSDDDMGGVTRTATAQLVAEFRAWCIWQRYWLDTQAALNGQMAGASPEIVSAVRFDIVVATRVLEAIPSWPTFRETRAGQRAEAIAQAVRRGNERAVLRSLRGCSSR